MLKKNSWVFWSILLISATNGLGWIVVIIMYLLIKYKYIDPDAVGGGGPYSVGNNTNNSNVDFNKVFESWNAPTKEFNQNYENRNNEWEEQERQRMNRERWK